MLQRLRSESFDVLVVGGGITGAGIAFDISGVLPHSEQSGNILGQLLRALFGYTSTPEWGALIAWIVYLGTVLTLYLRPMRPVAATGPATEHRPAST